jgi:glycosyltransferase involved in cell wall biosynthesis
MRILIVTQYFWPESFPINEIAKSLATRGHEVDILTGKPNYPLGKVFEGYTAWGFLRENRGELEITRIPLKPRGNNAMGLAINYLSFVVSGLLFAPILLRRKKADVIFVYAPSPILQALPALLLGLLKKCPVVLWVQDLWPESLSATGYVPNRIVLSLVSKVVRFIYKHSDLILVQSQAFIAPVRALADDTPIEYHPNSVNSSFTLSEHENTPEVEGLDGGFSILFAGNIGQAQAVKVIVEAAFLLKDYNDIRFVIIGEGSARCWMLEQAAQRGLNNINLPGRFPLESMPGLLKKASGLLVTLADREIFAATVPSKVQAYMAAGRPIIACLNGEGARLVEDADAGYATPAEDANALARTVLELYRETPERRDEMGDNGRNYYQKHFDHENQVDKLIEHLETTAKIGTGNL